MFTYGKTSECKMWYSQPLPMSSREAVQHSVMSNVGPAFQQNTGPAAANVTLVNDRFV